MNQKSKLLNLALPQPQNGSVALENEFTTLGVTSFVKMKRGSPKISEVLSSSKILRATLRMLFLDSTNLVLVSISNYQETLVRESVYASA